MNCPSCGSPTFADQPFCRSCGLELLVDMRRGPGPRVWAMIGLMMAFGGILMALAGKVSGVQWMLYAGVFVSISGMFFVAATSLLGRSRPRKRSVATSPQPEMLERSDTTNKLLPIGDDFIPSLVEGTTELLKTPVKMGDDDRT